MEVLTVLWRCLINCSGPRPLHCNSNYPLILFQNGWHTKERRVASRAMMWRNWRGSCVNSMHVLVVTMGLNTPAVQWQIFVRDWTDIWPRCHTVVKWTWCSRGLLKTPIKFSLENFVRCGKTVLIGRNTKMLFTLLAKVKLYGSSTLAIDNPVALQREVYLDASLHVCRMGREGLRELRKDSLMVKTDKNGREYVTRGYDELGKKTPGLREE